MRTIPEDLSWLAGRPCFCSWSGGKDCCLALHRALAQGAEVTHLVNMLMEGGARSRSHGIRPEVLEAQAHALGRPLVTAATTWGDYERTYIATLQSLQGPTAGIFGDMDTADHRAWEERVCAAAGMRAALPLWQGDRLALLDEFLGLGFEAMIITLRGDLLPPEMLGRSLSRELAAEMVAMGVDPCGEYGEFHTLVTDGPLFAQRVRVRPAERVQQGAYWSLDVALG